MFDNVYLCTQQNRWHSYKCSYFGSVLEADDYFDKHYSFNDDSSSRKRVNANHLYGNDLCLYSYMCMLLRINHYLFIYLQ